MCAVYLQKSGLSIEFEKFNFSEFPGRFAVPVIGYYSRGGSSHHTHFLEPRRCRPAGVTLAVGAFVIVASSRWLTRWGTSHVPWMRSQSFNLVARRGNPSVWLVAHIDSKSQTIPMLARIASIVVSVVAVGIMAASLVAAGLRRGAGISIGLKPNGFSDQASSPFSLPVH
jgi:hypothetical protein